MTHLVANTLSEKKRCLTFLIFFFLIVGGCASVSDRFSGATNRQNIGLAYPAHLEPLYIGRATKEEVRKLFGTPSDLQISSDASGARESWAYVKADPSIHPFQYVPILGVLALPHHDTEPSFALSFSPDGLLESIGLREAQPYGDEGDSVQMAGAVSSVQPYGRNNPLTHHSILDTLR